MNKETITDKAANGIANGILKSQTGFAICMHSITKNWEGRQQWIFLSAVCVCFGGLSIIAVVNPFRMQGDGDSIRPKSIVVPRNIHRQNNGFAITENELKKAQEYKAGHPNLQKERPGLFDSLSLIEEVYYLQKK
ncbi:MAG: hypothetical protein ABIU77_17295 [Ferruginibacter sp.]